MEEAELHLPARPAGALSAPALPSSLSAARESVILFFSPPSWLPFPPPKRDRAAFWEV